MKPIAVLISDVHYSLPTLQLADTAIRQAITKAHSLDVPLIVAGDLHDTKANLRGECVNAMIETFRRYKRCIILRGNHDALNEKSKEHSLNFLRPYADIIIGPERYDWFNAYLIPYFHDSNELRKYIKTIPKDSRLIMHQGLEKANMGDYVHDKSAINPEDVAGMQVISGHYHTRQTIQLPQGGVWNYIGNPYTLTFGEANDPEKGYQILYDDGSLKFVPTNLRKHLIINHDLESRESVWSSTPGYAGGGRNDLIWVKITGPKVKLTAFNKTAWCKEYCVPTNCRLDLIPTDSAPIQQTASKSQPELLDSIIDSLSDSDERKQRLKETWKSLV